MVSTVGKVRDVLQAAYPPELAEPWDAVGLICGDPDAEVTKVAFAVDCTHKVARRAVAMGAQLLVVHHPLLLRGVTSVAADTPKGKVIHELLRGGVALFAAHTNADSARPGVNDRLAELLGVTAGRPIEPKPQTLDKWGVMVPVADAEKVKEAMFAAGAGALGDYRECAFQFEGTGQFLPVAGANPALGQVGALEHVSELRVEFVAPTPARRAVERALRAAHPYEEPAFDIVQLANTVDIEQAYGIGRVGELDQPMPLKDFVQRVAERLPRTKWGVRAAGDPEKIVRRVAVSSGSGDSFLDAVRALDVDVFVTSDLRHHPVDEYLRAGGPAVVDTAHWASEFPWCAQAAGVVERELGLTTKVIDLRTDPWTISIK
ncbi:Nif3-like dinuclear metal center hexameric protein [Corynebacterium canis]|uniref:GTP cyclohydrolase 1 type 2 homolog n=1 Tax=Corynebacterium canis TaxID=679663 RepID=A0A5C5UQI6_9CORY|nr:Nif3-like dinuclear metal center hexameric protein [Corynebacterium canis]TWT28574.1 Nif3-like dinuclear metal center hexameric protein [Corynebacterium canis]WJY75835.1 Putative GTP cyclohydrolase 1 type 2 [Corynebacterium canis]